MGGTLFFELVILRREKYAMVDAIVVCFLTERAICTDGGHFESVTSR
jgi:hypothetical protein